MSELIVVRRHGLWVEVEIRTDILFPSGVATLSPAARAGAAAARGDAEAVSESDPRRRPHRQSSDQHARVPVELGAVVGACGERRAPVHERGHRSGAPRGDRPRRESAVAEQRHAEGRNANRRVLLVILSGNGMPEGDYAEERGKERKRLWRPSRRPFRPLTQITASITAVSG